MSRRFFSGRTLEQALVAAARHYQIEPGRVAYRQREKKHGFIKNRRGVVIEVDPASPERETASDLGLEPTSALRQQLPVPRPAQAILDRMDGVAPEPEASAAAPGRNDEPEVDAAESAAIRRDEASRNDARRDETARDAESADDDANEAEGEARDSRAGDSRAGDSRAGDSRAGDSGADDSEASRGRSSRRRGGRRRNAKPTTLDPEEIEDAFEEALERLLDVMDLEADWGLHLDDEGVVRIDLGGPDRKILVQEDGEVLKALGHLLPRVARQRLREGVPVSVDCGDFQEEHEERLREEAMRVADDVSEAGRAQRLEPMSPADRRLVHIALADRDDVETESEGGGFMKRVAIRPRD